MNYKNKIINNITLRGKYFSGIVNLIKDEYENGRLAIRAISPIGEPIATLSVNITDSELSGNEYSWFKNYSENEGFLESLEEQGIIEITGKIYLTGFVIVNEVKWLI